MRGAANGFLAPPPPQEILTFLGIGAEIPRRRRELVRIGLPSSPPPARIRQSGGDQFGLCGQQRGGIRAGKPCRVTRGQQLQDVAVLLPTSGHDTEHPLDESAARFAVGSSAALTPIAYESLC